MHASSLTRLQVGRLCESRERAFAPNRVGSASRTVTRHGAPPSRLRGAQATVAAVSYQPCQRSRK